MKCMRCGHEMSFSAMLCADHEAEVPVTLWSKKTHACKRCDYKKVVFMRGDVTRPGTFDGGVVWEIVDEEAWKPREVFQPSTDMEGKVKA